MIFTFTVTRQPTTPSFADEVPQIIAVVELTEGVHVTSVIVDAEPEQVPPPAPRSCRCSTTATTATPS